MKTLTLIFSMITFLALNSFSQNGDIAGLLKNPETRTEIFNTILNDHELMMELMKVMKGNEHAMMMMKENNQIEGNDDDMVMKSGQQMDHDKMMDMMKGNPEMMEIMMGNMMEMSVQDSTMRSKMADMMTEYPDMMQMCMQKMKNKGMMGADGKMKIMNQEDKNENKDHNH